MLSFFIYIVKADTWLWGCWPNQASLDHGDETWEEKRPVRWPANCPTNQSSESWGTHRARRDSGGWEADRFSTHGDVAKESCSVGTVLQRVSGWGAAGPTGSVANRPAGTTSVHRAQPDGKLPFILTAEIKSTTCLRLAMTSSHGTALVSAGVMKDGQDQCSHDSQIYADITTWFKTGVD